MTQDGTECDGIIVFSRLDSRRLPGKALTKIAGRTLLGRVLDRVRRVTGPKVVIATSNRSMDDPIAAVGGEEGVPVFRGSCEDVVGRAFACATQFGFRRFVRVSGDSPFIPPELISSFLMHHSATPANLLTNTFPRSFPPGASIEIIGRDFLEKMLGHVLDAEDREHVTRYAYRHPDDFNIINVSALDDRYKNIVLTVDEPADILRIEAIIRAMGSDSPDADLDRVVEAARQVNIRHPSEYQ